MSRIDATHDQLKLATYKKIIDADIASYVPYAIAAAGSQYGPGAAKTTEAFLDLVRRGGKRVRGALTMVGYEMLGGSDRQMITRAATAMEMIHAYMLVLDDIQDRSVLRRGRPTLHRVLTDSDLAGGNERVGANLAMNAALAGNHAAQMLLAGLNVDAELIRKVLGIVNLTLVITSHGQNLDLMIERRTGLPTDTELANLMQWKTAEYTFLNPLCVGMVLAGAGCEDTNAIREYALHAGQAFQVANDIQGIFGTTAANGKDVREDIREGKRTVLTVHSLRHAAAPDKEFLAEMLGNPDLSEAEFEHCRAIIRDSGSLEYAEHIRNAYIQAARAALQAVDRPWNAAYVQFLDTIIEQ
jgi:geranylgeranyl diphosphate synthase, type I